MTNGIRNIDPVQGLIDYVSDIKPYHTKIVEVLLEYVHIDTIDVTILDQLNLDISLERPYTVDLNFCDQGFDTEPFDRVNEYGFVVTELDTASNVFAIPGNVVTHFPVGSDVSVQAFYVDQLTDQLTSSSEDHVGTFTVQDINYIQGNALIQSQTEITVSSNFNDSIPSTSSDQYYQIDIVNSPLTIQGEIESDHNENRHQDIGSNMFIVDGNHTTRFRQGYVFKVVGGLNEGVYTTLYSDFVSGQTRIRVAEEIHYISGTGSPSLAPVGGIIEHEGDGFDPAVICFEEPEGNATSIIEDTLDFEWVVSSTFQFNIIGVDETLQTITVSGDARVEIQLGQHFQITNSASNDGVYEVRMDKDYREQTGNSEVQYDGTNTTIAVYGFGKTLNDTTPYGDAENL